MAILRQLLSFRAIAFHREMPLAIIDTLQNKNSPVETSLIINRGNSHSVRLSNPSCDGFVEPQLERLLGSFGEFAEVKIWEWSFGHSGIAQLGSEGVAADSRFD